MNWLSSKYITCSLNFTMEEKKFINVIKISNGKTLTYNSIPPSTSYLKVNSKPKASQFQSKTKPLG